MRKYSFQYSYLISASPFNKNTLLSLLGGFFFILLLSTDLLHAQNTVQSEKFIVESPTLKNLGFEWYIEGDDNRNARVKVEYRVAGVDSDWKKGMPLLRIGDEHIERAGIDYRTPHMFAGSILNLNTDTEYKARFTLKDPDGVEGEAVKVVNVATRGEPQAASGGEVRHVYPTNWQGEKKEPAYTGLLEAYSGSKHTKGDWYLVSEDQVQPGDVIKVHGGLYQADPLIYANPHSLPFDGTYFLTAKGTPERPIVIEAAGDGEVIFDGDGANNFFNVMATSNHIFEGITFRNADRVFAAGRKRLAGASGLTIRNCRFENVGEAIRTEYAGSKNFLIKNNVIIGRDDPYRLFGWAAGRGGDNKYGQHLLDAYYGVKVYGSGHVIAYNSVAYFHDGIGLSTYGTPEEEQELKPVSIDIYNNDIHLMADDCIESDGGAHNIRVMRNRCVNAAENGISAQPVFGGPAYWIRNVLYNIPNGGAFKIHGGVPGLIAYHNTMITENNAGAQHPNTNFRNNLFLGTDGSEPISVFGYSSNTSTSDYNGYRPNQGPGSPENQFIWNPPANDQGSDNAQGFKSLGSLNEASGLEEHGITVDYGIFENLQQPKLAKRGQPSEVYHATDLNFNLNPKGKAVDAGVVIPNVNGNFNGKAPDLGALEVGQDSPHYGVHGRDHPDKPFYR